MDYAAALTGQNQQLGELLRDADWSVPVPTCPGWTLLQLLRHVGRGDRWAAQIITDRADTSLDRPASADLAFSGPATDLLLALLRRRPVEDTGISMQGDTALWRSWLALTPL